MGDEWQAAFRRAWRPPKGAFAFRDVRAFAKIGRCRYRITEIDVTGIRIRLGLRAVSEAGWRALTRGWSLGPVAVTLSLPNGEEVRGTANFAVITEGSLSDRSLWVEFHEPERPGRVVSLMDLPESWNERDPRIAVGDRVVLHFVQYGESVEVTVNNIGPTTATLEPTDPPR